MIRHLIWDVDGTMFDTYPAIVDSLSAAAMDLGVSAPREEIHELALVSIDHCLETLCATNDLSLDLMTERFALHYQEVPPRTNLPSTEWRMCASSSTHGLGSTSSSPIADAAAWTTC